MSLILGVTPFRFKDSLYPAGHAENELRIVIRLKIVSFLLNSCVDSLVGCWPRLPLVDPLLKDVPHTLDRVQYTNRLTARCPFLSLHLLVASCDLEDSVVGVKSSVGVAS